MNGVIVRGTGSIGRRHLRVLRQLGIPAWAFPVRERAEELVIEGAPVVQSFESREARFAVIATDTIRHLADAREAVGAGMHVLIEKPIAPNLDEVSEFLSFAKATGRRVYVGCNLRYSRGLRELFDRLSDVGTRYSARIECQSYLPSWRPTSDYRTSYSARAADGGVLRDLVHEIDYAMVLFGCPKHASASLHNSGELGIESEESADLFWRTVDGCAVSVRLDYLSRIARRSTTIVGSAGELRWDAIAQTVTWRSSDGSAEHIDVREERDAQYLGQMTDFVSLVDRGSAPIATGDEALSAMRILDAARRSALSQRAELV
jgi:predicted dehydrogenase